MKTFPTKIHQYLERHNFNHMISPVKLPKNSDSGGQRLSEKDFILSKAMSFNYSTRFHDKLIEGYLLLYHCYSGNLTELSFWCARVGHGLKGGKMGKNPKFPEKQSSTLWREKNQKMAEQASRCFLRSRSPSHRMQKPKEKNAESKSVLSQFASLRGFFLPSLLRLSLKA